MKDVFCFSVVMLGVTCRFLLGFCPDAFFSRRFFSSLSFLRCCPLISPRTVLCRPKKKSPLCRLLLPPLLCPVYSSGGGAGSSTRPLHSVNYFPLARSVCKENDVVILDVNLLNCLSLLDPSVLVAVLFPLSPSICLSRRLKKFTTLDRHIDQYL